MAQRETRSDSKRMQTWGPYWLPMLTFLAIVTFGQSAPDAAEPWLLVLSAALPGGLFLWFARQGRYPELRGYPGTSTDVALDVAVGLLGAALWVAPFLFFSFLRPDEAGFDPQQFGATQKNQDAPSFSVFGLQGDLMESIREIRFFSSDRGGSPGIVS